MSKKVRLLLIWLFIVGVGTDGWAQNSRYMVFFKDKAGSPYTIDNPEAYLSQRAILRRSNQNLVITEQDLPVNPNYIQQIKDQGVNVFYATKWLNGVMVQASEAQIELLNGLAIVDSTIFVAPGEKLSFNSRKYDKTSVQEVQSVVNEVQLKTLGIPSLHNQGYKGEEIYMAFFDGGFSGVDTVTAFQPVFLSNRLLYHHNFVENNQEVFKASTHGTRVFSTVSGLLDGYQGVATEASFMLCITEDETSEYRVEEYNWLIAAEKADSIGIDIINSSLGYDIFDDPTMNYPFEALDGATTVITQAANLAIEKGILVVVSVGNAGNATDGTGPWQEITAPADAPFILSVGSVNADGSRSSFSSRGPTADGRIKPEVVAIGSGTQVVTSSGVVTVGSGTSFAAPQIAGLAALLWQADPTMTNLELRQLIIGLGNQADSPTNQVGYGIPNYNTILAVEETPGAELKVFPNPVADFLKLKLPAQSDTDWKITIYTPLGHICSEREISNIESSEATINVSTLSKGLYFLEMRNGKARHITRIVKF